MIHSINTVKDFIRNSTYVIDESPKRRIIEEDKEPAFKRRRIIRTPCDKIHDFCMNTKYKCCICMDRRMVEELYDGYVDGIGFIKNKQRHEHYCMSCKEKCQN